MCTFPLLFSFVTGAIITSIKKKKNPKHLFYTCQNQIKVLTQFPVAAACFKCVGSTPMLLILAARPIFVSLLLHSQQVCLFSI